jgi:very-short-patch-repair endonuclease
MLGVPAELEKFDGYKTIDIAVVEAKVNIEVDGMQHKYNSRQALADLKRTYYSFKKGYITLRIPNTLINWNVNETAKYIFDFLNESEERNWEEDELTQEDWNDIFDVEDLEDFEHD